MPAAIRARYDGQDDAWDAPVSDDESDYIGPDLRRYIRAYHDSHEWWAQRKN